MPEYVRILKNDGIGRFRSGEIGLILGNDFDKYDFKIELGYGYSYLPGDDKVRKVSRVYYFYENEVEQIWPKK